MWISYAAFEPGGLDGRATKLLRNWLRKIPAQVQMGPLFRLNNIDGRFNKMSYSTPVPYTEYVR